ncbi:MAG: rod shape-determining protein MreC, partial [Alphaproteobacteria bacterium]
MKRRIKAKSFSIVAPISFWDKPLASLIFVLFSIVLLFLSGLNPGVFNTLRNTTSNVFSPVISAVSYPVQEATQFVRSVSGLSSLQAKNAALEKENARLREWYQTALTLQKQNESLKDLLNVKLEPQYQYMTARIIADVGSAFVKSLLVKAGEHDGVQKGQAVI